MAELTVREALPFARALCPPLGLVHVGAASGIVEMRVWRDWSVSDVLAIDLYSEAPWTPTEHIRYLQAVPATIPGAATIVRSRLSSADGLLSVAAVQSAWPGVRDLRTETVNTQTLDALVPESVSPTWLIVDSLPAGETLAGAARVLATLQVLWARVSLDAIPHWPDSARLAFVDNLARHAGMRRLAISPGVDPRLGQVLYVRDPLRLALAAEQATQALESTRAEVSTLKAVHEAQCAQTVAVEAELDRIRMELNGVSSEKASVSGVLNVVRGELSAARQQLDAARDLLNREDAEKKELRIIGDSRLTELNTTKSMLARIENELRACNERLTSVTAERDLARTNAVAVVNERTSLLDRLAAVKAELDETRAALEETRSQSAELRGALVAHQQSGAHMEDVRDEMTRVEAQLDLIKEIVGLRPDP